LEAIWFDEGSAYHSCRSSGNSFTPADWSLITTALDGCHELHSIHDHDSNNQDRLHWTTKALDTKTQELVLDFRTLHLRDSGMMVFAALLPRISRNLHSLNLR
jgi:hypothetical protein